MVYSSVAAYVFFDSVASMVNRSVASMVYKSMVPSVAYRLMASRVFNSVARWSTGEWSHGLKLSGWQHGLKSVPSITYI
jgi:hypothetical protein